MSRAVWSGSGRLSREDYSAQVLGYFGPHLRSVAREYGIPLEDLIFDCSRAFARLAEMKRSRARDRAAPREAA